MESKLFRSRLCAALCLLLAVAGNAMAFSAEPIIAQYSIAQSPIVALVKVRTKRKLPKEVGGSFVYAADVVEQFKGRDVAQVSFEYSGSLDVSATNEFLVLGWTSSGVRCPAGRGAPSGGGFLKDCVDSGIYIVADGYLSAVSSLPSESGEDKWMKLGGWIVQEPAAGWKENTRDGNEGRLVRWSYLRPLISEWVRLGYGEH